MNEKIEFTANDIANEVARTLIEEVAGDVSDVMTVLTMVQALVVKNCLIMINDPLNMPRADVMLDMCASESKKAVRTLSARVAN